MDRIRVICILLFLLIDSSIAHGKAVGFNAPSNSYQKIPSFLTIGVIPFQGFENSPQKSQTLQKFFSKSVVESRRFRVLNNDLVASLWNSNEGRKELSEEFEANGFMALSGVESIDQVTFKAYLLDPEMNPLMIESETQTKDWFDHVADTDLENFIQDLAFRLINRLPTDVTVTSIQGSFLTLSGGIEQSLQIGDQLAIVRVRLKSVHPAHKTWLEFHRTPQGSAQIIEVNNQSSIAKITEQIFDGAIEVGDGAKLPSISARRKFASTQNQSTFRDTPPQDPIVVPSLIINESKSAPASSPPISSAKKPKSQEQSPATQENEEMEEDSKKNKSENEPATSPPVNEDQEEKSVWDSFSQEATSHKILEALTVYAGPTWWSIRGPTNSSGRIPLYLFNHFGAKVARTMFFKFKLNFGGGVLFGQTPRSNYIGYESSVQFFWEDYLTGDFLNYWRAGGAGSFNGFNVAKGSYGGGDWIRGGFFGGLGGFFKVGDPETRFDWFGDYTILPLNIGRVGYDGSFKQVESSLGWSFNLGAFLWAAPEEIQYGGMLTLGDERMTLKNGRRPNLKDYSIKALLRFAL